MVCETKLKLASLEAQVASLKLELVKEAKATAEQKLRADQMSKQHSHQASLNREARSLMAGLANNKKGSIWLQDHPV